MEKKDIELKEYTEKDMKKAIKESSLITSLAFILFSLVIVFIVLFFDLYKLQEQEELPTDLRKYLEIIDLYEQNYVEDIDLTKSVDYSIGAFIAATGDEYGGYVPVSEGAITGSEILTGNYYGIGITFLFQDTYLEVVEIVKDSPAGRSELKAGDKIVKIDGEEISLEVYEKFRLNISNKSVDEVVLTLDDSNEIIIQLGEVKTPKLDLVIEGNTAYISIYTFVKDSVDLFENAFKEIVNNNEISDLVFDLRNNRGGDVDAVTAMLDYILDECVLITIDNANENIEDESIYSDSFNILNKDYNVKVIVNRNTASASELFTSVLRHYMNAVVVGETTYGKGTVVTCYTFKDGSVLMLSSGRYTTPDGSYIEDIGIIPDIFLSEEQLLKRANELKSLGLLEKSSLVY